MRMLTHVGAVPEQQVSGIAGGGKGVVEKLKAHIAIKVHSVVQHAFYKSQEMRKV